MLMFAVGGRSAAAEYRLDSGDVLELTFVANPNRQRAAVDVDGQIALPLIGQLRVAGLTISEVRQRVEGLLPTKAYWHRTSEGRDSLVVVTPEEISLNIAEYRPIYVSGDIAKPGEQSYRPNLTVRQVVALAGGYDVGRFRVSNPFLESAELAAQHESLWTELVREEARSARLRAQLGEKVDSTRLDGPNPLPLQVVADIRKREAEQASVEETNYRKEKEFLQLAIKQSERRLSILNEQHKKEEEGARADAEELERARGLVQKGQALYRSVTDARRAMLASSTRALETSAEAARVEKDLGETRRRLQRLDDERRIQALRELQDANVRAGNFVSQLRGVSEKLMYTGIIKSQLVRGQREDPELVIFRKHGGEVQRVAAQEDTLLYPGDVLEVALRVPTAPNTNTAAIQNR